jgi:hypothetical protein
MKVYAIDEQVAVELDRQPRGFAPRSVRLYVPGHAENMTPSSELRKRCFATEADAAAATFDELKREHPEIFAHWTTREGFL